VRPLPLLLSAGLLTLASHFSAAAADEASPAPLPTPLAAAEAIEPGGGTVPLAPSIEAIVDPASSFRVVLPGRSDDARLSLLDGADTLVPATATREVGERTVLTVTPRQPLTAAAHYLLRLDGARARDLHDAAGRAAGPVELHVVVAGSAPEPPRKAVRGTRRR